MKKLFLKLFIPAAFLVAVAGCQKMKRPDLGNFPADKTVTPTTALRFYVPFDSVSSASSQLNIRFMDSISGYPCFFPASGIKAIPGIKGTAYSGTNSTFLNYYNSNDFAQTASSFTIAFWEKRNGIPKGNASFVFTIPSSNGQWGSYGFSMFLLFDWGTWTPTSDAIVKFYMVDDNCKCDTWLTWEGGNKVPGVQDNNWHHMAFVYDATTSKLTLYVDGVANPNVPQWGSHGAEKIDGSKVTGLNIGGNTNIKDMGWGQNWDGGLDQFRMYNKALTAAEVAALYNGKQ